MHNALGIEATMTDIFDQAQEHEQKALAQYIQVQEQKAANATYPKPSGFCLNAGCSEPFEADSARLFCGAKCADKYDWQLKQKR